ncbi:MAG: phosphoribosylformylglycinamidine synthase subunit PurS [Candidatus Omnitrophica bacterium]|nr:phosphoribosylformylglycinamidine synthase subunit PurS [Candidatus Omnitrophota bacterium]
MYRVKIDVTLKKTVLDPQGKTVLLSLHSMGFPEAHDLRVGKFFDLTLDVTDEESAKKKVAEICDRLLVNPVIEDYSFAIEKI